MFEEASLYTEFDRTANSQFGHDPELSPSQTWVRNLRLHLAPSIKQC